MNKDWREEYIELVGHTDGCLFELHEVYNENHGKNSCTCGLERQVDLIEQLLKAKEKEVAEDYEKELQKHKFNTDMGGWDIMPKLIATMTLLHDKYLKEDKLNNQE